VPPDHLVRQIDSILDLSWVHKELAPYYSHTGRPSIDPVLMIKDGAAKGGPGYSIATCGGKRQRVLGQDETVVVRFARGQREAHGLSLGIDDRMNLGLVSPPHRPFSCSPLSKGPVPLQSNRGARIMVEASPARSFMDGKNPASRPSQPISSSTRLLQKNLKIAPINRYDFAITHCKLCPSFEPTASRRAC
jgi:hypothetical protein